jgi:hypothetical protein
MACSFRGTFVDHVRWNVRAGCTTKRERRTLSDAPLRFSLQSICLFVRIGVVRVDPFRCVHGRNGLDNCLSAFNSVAGWWEPIARSVVALSAGTHDAYVPEGICGVPTRA